MIAEASQIDRTVERALERARVPGAAIAIVRNGRLDYAQGYGVRDLHSRSSVTTETLYPIASTSKAFNATLLASLCEDGLLDWDAPVRDVLPEFRMADETAGKSVSLRDLVALRSGLPRHDWAWIDEPINRSELVARIAHLPLTAPLRERFQYTNLSPVVAACAAERVTGRSWETLIEERILEPAGMTKTRSDRPSCGNIVTGYLERAERTLARAPVFRSEAAAPSGGALHSTVRDMARWLQLNLGRGEVEGRHYFSKDWFATVHEPQVAVGGDPSGPSPGAWYALGWFVDEHEGTARLSHGGYLHAVSSHVALFPKRGIGVVSFINFGPAGIAPCLNRAIFDVLEGREADTGLDDRLREYERIVEENAARRTALARKRGTEPSLPVAEYAGCYRHPGYGQIMIGCEGGGLVLERGSFKLGLQHWDSDRWVIEPSDLFEIHRSCVFDCAGLVSFVTEDESKALALEMQLEENLLPARFVRVETPK
jgi:CubicO group peptidase (beta-lactamase class C family)